MRLLITAFGPFPGVPKNPSETLARRLARDRRLRAAGIVAEVRVFPTEYEAVRRMVADLAKALRPDVVLMLGVASRRRHLSVERVGANRASILHPDASGATPDQILLDIGGPTVRRARAPLTPVTIAAGRAGFPTRVSRTAGTYLCNASYFHMLGALPATTPCLFLHIPRTRTPAARQRLLAATLAAALRLIRFRSRRA